LLVAIAMTIAPPPTAGAQEAAPPAGSAQPAPAQAGLAQVVAAPLAVPAHALHISAGDLIEVSVFDTPELSGKLRVDENGAIVMPIAGVVVLAGLTSEQAGSAIEGRLRSADIMKDPHVAVFITEYATQGVTVAGEVKSVGIYPLLGSHGLLDVLTAAGGVTPTAGRLVSIAHKNDPEHPEMIKFDNRPGRIVANVDIEPGDTIIVSRAGVCYVVGDVGKPGGYLIEGNDRLTVLQVVALAGGASKTAAPDGAKLVRKTAHGREEMAVPLKAIFNGTVADMPLEDNDILYVPSSKGKLVANRSVDLIIALTLGLALSGKF
jgi:polysaccharide export outer membrane protein